MAKYIVRFGAMRLLGAFATSGGKHFSRGDRVVIRTSRGLEVGDVLREATDEATAKLKSSETGRVLREMTHDDLNELQRIQDQESSEFQTCLDMIERLNLEMDLVDVEHIFGGERIVVYYLAEARIDFRELVKLLASEFQTRIEMRQIGVRDEAKLMADFGDCGKPVCCNNHLVSMPPVSMKMAKLQKATLDPTKISGRCGRLKCCLRYEFDSYEAMQKEMPPVGSRVATVDEKVRVLGQEILAGKLYVETEEKVRKLIDLSEVVSREPSPKRQRRAPRKNGEDRTRK